MLEELWRFLRGYLEVEVQGQSAPAFLNLSTTAALGLWGVRYRPGSIIAFMHPRDFSHVRPVARGARVRVRIRRRIGLPFFTVRLRSRRMLLLGAVAAVVALLWLSSHIWVVDVRGASELDQRAVRAVVAGLGLKPGAWRPRVNVRAIEAALPQKLPQIAWAGVTVQGTRAVVQLVERRTAAPAPPAARVDLVASRACQLVKLVATAGHPAAKEGAMVYPGQVLIEGQEKVRADGVAVPNQAVPDPDIVIREVRAQGIARGRCWYKAYYELPQRTIAAQPTGKSRWRLVLRWKGRDMIQLGRSVPWPYYSEQRRVLTIPLERKTGGAVELHLVTFRELQVRVQQATPQQLVDQAKAKMQAYLDWQLAPGDTVEQISARLVQQSGNSGGLSVLAQVLQEIGRPVSGGP